MPDLVYLVAALAPADITPNVVADLTVLLHLQSPSAPPLDLENLKYVVGTDFVTILVISDPQTHRIIGTSTLLVGTQATIQDLTVLDNSVYDRQDIQQALILTMVTAAQDQGLEIHDPNHSMVSA